MSSIKEQAIAKYQELMLHAQAISNGRPTYIRVLLIEQPPDKSPKSMEYVKLLMEIDIHIKNLSKIITDPDEFFQITKIKRSSIQCDTLYRVLIDCINILINGTNKKYGSNIELIIQDTPQLDISPAEQP